MEIISVVIDFLFCLCVIKRATILELPRLLTDENSLFSGGGLQRHGEKHLLHVNLLRILTRRFTSSQWTAIGRVRSVTRQHQRLERRVLFHRVNHLPKDNVGVWLLRRVFMFPDYIKNDSQKNEC